MRTTLLSEPELEFGTGKHIDIKFGLMNYAPLDFDLPLSPKQIKLGIIGIPETIEGIVNWLDKIRLGVTAKESKRPSLFPRFPGYGEGQTLTANFLIDKQLQRPISPRTLEAFCRKPRSPEVIKEIAQLYLDEVEYLAQKTTADVIICGYSPSLVEYIDRIDQADITQENDSIDEDGDKPYRSTFQLRDYLKAQAMRFHKPTQVIRPATYGVKLKRKRRDGVVVTKQLQDEATRAWNLYTALYYKAGGTPWRLIRDSTQLSACYVGVSFFKTLDETKLLTSTAQVFNELGEGIILRGGAATIHKDDRQIHLSAEDAYNLLRNALEIYRREHKTFPARVVIHKTSIHNQDEIDGFEKALQTFSIEPEQADFLSITDSNTRLFRPNRYPPLRGTFLETGGSEYILYTKGSVDFFSTYPGLYVPVPLAFRCDRHAETPLFLAKEILALTKMNWNNTQFDGGEPITLRAAQEVGSILKYLDESTAYEPYYRFYM
ncbi:MAG: hypothetical protein R3E39_26520 [Anaerolineae bacterium]